MTSFTGVLGGRAAQRLAMPAPLAPLARVLQTFLPAPTTREVLLAASGCKVARTCASEEDALRLEGLAAQHGFRVKRSDRKVVHRHDVGKGGWSNTLQAVLPADAVDGDVELYVARDAEAAARAADAERGHDDDRFGRLLGIPACCRRTYPGRAEQARRKQNDFVPLVAAATPWRPPFDPWTNYVAQYFGAGLLSHFPCSFRCAATAALARRADAFLSSIDSGFARRLREPQWTNILYTEYSGVIALPRSRTDRTGARTRVTYDASRVTATAASPVVETLKRGDHLTATAVSDIEVGRGEETIARLQGEDIALCLFQ